MLILNQKPRALLGKATFKDINFKEQYPDGRRIMEDLFTELRQHTRDVLQQGARIPAQAED
jgi:hypothetical protein